MNFLTHHRRSKSVLVVWALLLVLGQTLTLAHQHVDEAPEASCAICTLSHAETAASDRPAAALRAPASFAAAPPADAPALLARRSNTFQARAPPLV